MTWSWRLLGLPKAWVVKTQQITPPPCVISLSLQCLRKFESTHSTKSEELGKTSLPHFGLWWIQFDSGISLDLSRGRPSCQHLVPCLCPRPQRLAPWNSRNATEWFFSVYSFLLLRCKFWAPTSSLAESCLQQAQKQLGLWESERKGENAFANSSRSLLFVCVSVASEGNRASKINKSPVAP